MLKKMIERSVRKQIALKSLEDKTSSVIVEHMNHERREKEKAIAEVLELKEKLEASERREKSLHKELEDYSRELFDLRNTFKDLSEPIVLKISPKEEAKIQLNAVCGKPFDWDKLMKQLDGIGDNLADEDVNNLPFYTLDYSVDGQQESLINLSLHDCEELYGQIIGSLEYFKMTKQEKFIEELSNEYIAYGETFGNNLLNYGVFSSLNNLCNEVLRRPDLKLSKAIRFYKNGKRFAVLDIGTILFTDIDDIRKEIFRLEKEIDEND